MNTRSWVGMATQRARGIGSPEERFQRAWVGLDPGSGWSQALTAQETSQGYKKTDVITLQLKIGALRTKVDELVSQADPSTDPSSMAMLTKLASDVAGLDTDAALFAQGKAGWAITYPSLVLRYSTLAAVYASFGIEQVTAPAPAPSAANPAPAPVTATEKHAASPSAPVIVKKAPSTWGYWLAAGLGLVGVALVGAGVLK